MTFNWLDNLRSRLPGPAGAPAGGPSGRHDTQGATASGCTAGVRPAHASCIGWLRAALLVVCLTPLQAIAASNGDQIVNRAALNTREFAPVVSLVTVTVSSKATPAKIEFLKYAPLLSGALQEKVSTTFYRTGSDPTAAFAPLPAPVPAGSSTPIDLTRTVPLASTEVFHQCEPIFVRLTDQSSNLDPAHSDSAVVTVSDPATGDVEVLRLTETGPNTGVFTGYIQSSGGACQSNPAPGTYSGYLPVSDASKITAQFSAAGGTESTSCAAIVDPFGRVFNSVTGKPVDGAIITLIDADTGTAATVFGDDGKSTFPTTADHSITSGGVPAPMDSSGRVYAYAPGQFRFPFVLPGKYRFKVMPPPGYAIHTATNDDASLQALPGGPFALATGSRLETFTVNPGPSLQIDIPIDPLPASLWLQKTAGKSIVAIGDFLPYQLDLLNNADTATAINVTITDTLPPGFRYRKGSTTRLGKRSADPVISADGRTLSYTLDDLAPKASASLSYVVEVAAGAKVGSALNVATAHSFATSSNTAQATVQVQSDFLTSRSILMGRVGRGPCNLDWDEGVAGIRIYLEDGSFVISDKRGLFHFEGVQPGTHVVQLDLDSLPEGYAVYSCADNTRFAGRSFSQFVDLKGGTMWRTDFRVGRPDDAALYEKKIADRAAAELKAAEDAIEVIKARILSEETARKAAEAAAKEEAEEEAVPADDWAEPAKPATKDLTATIAPGAATATTATTGDEGDEEDGEAGAVAPADPLAAPSLSPVAAGGPGVAATGAAPDAAVAAVAPSAGSAPAILAKEFGAKQFSPIFRPVLMSAPASAQETVAVCLFPKGPVIDPAPDAGDQEPAKEEPRLGSAGILSPADGSALPDAISAVRVVLDSNLTPQLFVDGTEIAADRIGFTLKDNKSEKTLYSYIGINFGDPGVRIITLKGKDPFGVVRLEKTAKVTRVGAISYIRFVGAEGNVADGKTPVRMKLELFDAAGIPFRSATELQILEGSLKPLKKELAIPDAVLDQSERVQVDADGYVLFQPVTASGPYRAVLGAGKVTVEAETYAQPKLRDWILVGLGEGSAGFNAVSGHMENLRASGTDENLYENGRLAFYGKGTIQGKWLLSLAYDSAKASPEQGKSLFQTINPETFYTLYGDASRQQYDASSARKLYLKIEREQFYAMFGDFDTNLTVTELSRYSRRMNGFKSEWQGKNYEANVFGTNTPQAYARDEIAGDGTSGLYHLSRKPIVLNSEKITIQTRDRYRSEIIVKSQVMSRFSDYSIDYDTGAIFFKAPILDRDENYNPIFIVAEYEVVDAGTGALTYGGRVGAKLLDNKLKTGFTLIHEGQATGEGNSYGFDTSYKVATGTTLKGEAATSSSNFGGSTREGKAYLAELQHQTPALQGRVYFREQDAGFGLGQQNGSETGTRKFGVDATYKLSDALSLNGLGYRQYNLSAGAVQNVMEAKSTYTTGPYSAHLGMRYASDTLGDGSEQVSSQLTMGGSWLTLNKRLTLKLDHDQSLGGNNNASFPTRTALGAEYKLTEKMSVMAQQELTSGSGATTNTTRLGLKSAPWSGAAVNTSMERDGNENGDRLFALFGLKQTWKITDKLSVDGGLDRSQTVKKTGNYTFNVNVPPTVGAAQDFTAVSLGGTYTEKLWNWNNRVEYRTSTLENKWGVVSAFIGEPKEGWGWSGRLQLFETNSSVNGSTSNDELRLGLVYRPLQTRWIILDRLDFIYSSQGAMPTTIAQESRRAVNNLNANFKPDRQSELSLQYGTKYVLETIDKAKYSGFTDLIGVEGRYDLTRDWDIGARCSLLHSWGSGQASYSTGLSVGYNVVQNAWISLGYNLVGFSDKDFTAAGYTAQGPYLRFRFKFDQNSVKDALKWVNL